MLCFIHVYIIRTSLSVIIISIDPTTQLSQHGHYRATHRTSFRNECHGLRVFIRLKPSAPLLSFTLESFSHSIRPRSSTRFSHQNRIHFPKSKTNPALNILLGVQVRHGGLIINLHTPSLLVLGIMKRHGPSPTQTQSVKRPLLKKTPPGYTSNPQKKKASTHPSPSGVPNHNLIRCLRGIGGAWSVYAVRACNTWLLLKNCMSPTSNTMCSANRSAVSSSTSAASHCCGDSGGMTLWGGVE